MKTDNKTLRNYLLWAFGLAWPLQGLASYFALKGQTQVFTTLTIAVMFTPLAAVFLAKIPLRDIGWGLKLRGKWKWFFAVWFLPIVLTALGAALYYALFPASFAPGENAVRAQYGEEMLAQLEARGLTPSLLIALTFAGAATYAPFVNALPSLGEEVGWRGALYPMLKERFGKAKGRLLGGAIWGAWHWPLMIFAGYEYGLRYWGAPVLGMALFLLFTISLGALLDLACEKTGSIWIPSLGHGAINAAANLPAIFLNPDFADRLTLGPLPIGVISGLPLMLLAALVFFKGGREEEIETE